MWLVYAPPRPQGQKSTVRGRGAGVDAAYTVSRPAYEAPAQKGAGMGTLAGAGRCYSLPAQNSTESEKFKFTAWPS